MASDSSGSSSRSYSASPSSRNLRYSDRDARRFKDERDATRHELEVISKQAGIAELEWQHQCKQLLDAIDGESCDLLNLNLILNKLLLLFDPCRSRCRAQSAEGAG
jgi:hypothetical protein